MIRTDGVIGAVVIGTADEAPADDEGVGVAPFVFGFATVTTGSSCCIPSLVRNVERWFSGFQPSNAFGTPPGPTLGTSIPVPSSSLSRESHHP